MASITFVLFLALIIVNSGLGETSLRTKRYEMAAHFLGAKGESWARIASAQSSQENGSSGRAAANKALDFSLGHVRAIRVLALDEYAKGDQEKAKNLMNLGANLSWRDSPTQAWLFDQELRAGNYDKAMDHAESLMRRGRFEERIFEFLTLAALEEDIRAEIVVQFQKRSNWRSRFFGVSWKINPAYHSGFKKLAEALRESDAPITEQELLPFANELLKRDETAEALEIWQQHFPQRLRRTMVTNEELSWPTDARFRTPYPLDWRMTDGTKTKSRVSNDGHLEVDVQSSVGREVAWKLLPANAATAGTLKSDVGDLNGVIILSLACAGDGEKRILESDGRGTWQFLHSPNCPILRLSLKLSRKADALAMTKISIPPLRLSMNR